MAEPSKDDAAADQLERQMAAAREIMGKDWVVLRALALGDQYPGADVSTLLKMVREQQDRSAKAHKS